MPHLTVDGCSLGFDDSGPLHGPALVLLHGFLGCKEDWRPIRAGLDRRRRVVAVDLPGHGTTRVDRFPHDYSLDGCCRLLEGLIERTALRDPILVGYSMGARVALALALRAQHRLRGLVLEGVSPGIAEEERRRARLAEDEERALTLERHGLGAFVAGWETQPLFGSQASLSEATRRRQRQLRLRGDPRELAASLRAAGTGTQPWFGNRLGGLNIPVLLVTGALDAKFGAIAERMVDELPAAEWVSVEEAGHNVHLERPESFTATVGAFADRVAKTDEP